MKLFPVLLGVFLAGCAASGGISGKPLPDITFQHIQPLQLPVSDVVIDDRSNGAASQSENFRINYEEVVQNYVRRKLQPAGGDETVTVAIENLSVKESYEASPSSFASFFDVAGANVYDVHLELRIAARAPNGAEKGVRLNAARKIKVSEHASIAAREQKQLQGLETMFRELDSSVTRIVLEDLGLGPVVVAPAMPVQGGLQNNAGQWQSHQPPVPLYNSSPEDEAAVAPPSASDARTGVIERQEL